MHYYRQRRSGEPGEASRRQREVRPTCRVEDCDAKAVGTDDLCPKHYSRMLRHGSPDIVLRPGSVPGERLHEMVSYTGMHARLRYLRGAASAHTCSRCSRQAQHWAYDHSDPAEIVVGGRVYSLDLTRYVPMCSSCHRRYDMTFAPPPRTRLRPGFAPEVRDVVMVRSGGICERCLTAPVQQAHHRCPRQRGGSRSAWINLASNAAGLCAACHEYVETHRAEAVEGGWLVRRGEAEQAGGCSAFPIVDAARRVWRLFDDGRKIPC